MSTRQDDADKDAGNSAVERALAFYFNLRRMLGGLIFSIFVVALPIVYVMQDGWTAGLWFLGASIIVVLISLTWKPTYSSVRSFIHGPKFQDMAKKHMKEIYSESKSWVIGIGCIFYVLAITLLFPGNSGTQFPNNLTAMLLLSGFYAFSSYLLIQAPDLMRASKLEIISKSFNVPESTLRRRIEVKYPLAPRTSSINFLATLLFAIGTAAFLYGVVWIVYWLTGAPEPIFGAFREGYEGAVLGLTLIIFGLMTLYVGYGVRQMSKAPAVLAVILAIGTALCLSLPILIYSPLWVVLPKPPYINLIWVLGIPLVICIIVVWNWKKMRWAEKDLRELSMFLGTSESEKEDLDILTESKEKRKGKVKKPHKTLIEFIVITAVIVIAANMMTRDLFGTSGPSETSVPPDAYELSYNFQFGESYTYDISWRMEYQENSIEVTGSETLNVVGAVGNEFEIQDLYNVQVTTTREIQENVRVVSIFRMTDKGLKSYPEIVNVEPPQLREFMELPLWSRYTCLGLLCFYPMEPITVGHEWNVPRRYGFIYQTSELWTQGNCSFLIEARENVTVGHTTFDSWRLTQRVYVSGENVVANRKMKIIVSGEATSWIDTRSGAQTKLNLILSYKELIEDVPEYEMRENITMELVEYQAP